MHIIYYPLPHKLPLALAGCNLDAIDISGFSQIICLLYPGFLFKPYHSSILAKAEFSWALSKNGLKPNPINFFLMKIKIAHNILSSSS